MDYTVRLEQSGEQLIPRLVEALRDQGLQATVSFDLSLARLGQSECYCPYHGQAECTCQYAILLVFDPGQDEQSCRTITIHGRDETVWLTLLQNSMPHRENPGAQQAVETRIMHVLLNLVAPVQKVGPAEMDTSEQ